MWKMTPSDETFIQLSHSFLNKKLGDNLDILSARK